MATHSSILAWKIPWKEEPHRLQSMGSQRVRHELLLPCRRANCEETLVGEHSLEMNMVQTVPSRELPAFLTLSWQLAGILCFGNFQGHLLQKACSTALMLARGKIHTCWLPGVDWHVRTGFVWLDTTARQLLCLIWILLEFSFFWDQGVPTAHSSQASELTYRNSASFIHPNLLLMFGCDFNPAEKSQGWYKELPWTLYPESPTAHILQHFLCHCLSVFLWEKHYEATAQLSKSGDLILMQYSHLTHCPFHHRPPVSLRSILLPRTHPHILFPCLFCKGIGVSGPWSSYFHLSINLWEFVKSCRALAHIPNVFIISGGGSKILWSHSSKNLCFKTQNKCNVNQVFIYSPGRRDHSLLWYPTVFYL